MFADVAGLHEAKQVPYLCDLIGPYEDHLALPHRSDYLTLPLS